MSYKETIQAWLDGVQIDLIKNYEQTQKASGKWGKTLDNDVKSDGANYVASISGQRYTGAIIEGRKPNTNQDREALKAWVGWAGSTFLKQWVKDKGLSLSPYAVAWSIAEKGIKVPNTYNDGKLISRVMTTDRVQELGKDLGNLFLVELKQDVISKLVND